MTENRQHLRWWARKTPDWFHPIVLGVVMPLYLAAGLIHGFCIGLEDWRHDVRKSLDK